ncbi:hypothetical protein THZG08_150012 [Vibrio owensii]|uniref:Uncharacterized protein n=1 Tax=Vibrio owensii TaxID=696485 RepID=A0AAU9Q9S0_9VIBR|nr:hypothetical protein THZG08_150012 [Vibrio owensii]CAH1536567.1 hypothetical protein THF1D04_40448 [Vibrio owensii]CAH1552209.1 hypothetical protein THOA03_140110 [Vibrio owensii]CAH1595635.1 hypothetical protein THOD04_50046 [Vibrio owensii]
MRTGNIIETTTDEVCLNIKTMQQIEIWRMLIYLSYPNLNANS